MPKEASGEVSNKSADAVRAESWSRIESEEREIAYQYLMVNEHVLFIYYSEGRKYYITRRVTLVQLGQQQSPGS